MQEGTELLAFLLVSLPPLNIIGLTDSWHPLLLNAF